jgi:TetR/AcrR family transcriptional repressor of nem operon
MPQVLNSSYEDLVKKAQNLFWLKGFKGANVDELAEHLDVSTSTIYNKYSKEMLFIASLTYYSREQADPFFKQLQKSSEGMDSLRKFFYKLIDSLLNKTFPKSCFMVNTVVELRNENPEVVHLYDNYFNNLETSYLAVLDSAIALGQIQFPERKSEYAKFLLGMVFSLSILYKINEHEELYKFVDEQLLFIE